MEPQGFRPPGARDGVDPNNEFQRFFEKDIGVTFYRYVPKNQDPEHTIGEIYILQTSDDIKYQVKTNDVLPFDDNKISCPYCIKLIEKAEKLFIDEPSDKQQELAGVCSHCRRTFAKKSFQAATKSGKGLATLDSLKTQPDTNKDRQREYKYVKQGSIVSETLEKDGQIKDKYLRKRTTSAKTLDKDGQREDKYRKKIPTSHETLDKDEPEDKHRKKGPKSPKTIDKDEPRKDKHLKKEETSPETLDRQLRSTEEKDEEQAKRRKSKGKKHEDRSQKDERNNTKEEKLISKSKKLTDKEESAKEPHEKSKGKGHLMSKNDVLTTKDEKLKAKDNKTDKSKEKEGNLRAKSSSAHLLQAQITQEKQRKQEAENKRKEQEKEKKARELAEKRAKEAESRLKREMESKAKRSLSKILPTDSEVSMLNHRAMPIEPVVGDVIVGEKIYKIKRKRTNEELGVDEIGKSPINKMKTINSQKQDKGPGANAKSEKVGKRVDGLQTPNKGFENLGKGVDGSQSPDKGPVVETGRSEKTPVVGLDKHGKVVQDSGMKNKSDDGVIRFTLSDPTFIDKGWTMLPLEKVVRKMNVYRMRPAKPEFDWFERNKGKMLEYSSGEKLAALDDSGRGRVYYRNGELALDYYDAEETNAGRRFVVYSTGTPDERGRPRPKTVLATFDYSGNGIVFDHNGKTRLKYNQTEGVVLDQNIGPVSNWKWHALNDPPLLQQVMIDTQLDHKIPEIFKMDSQEHPRKDDEAMLAIELDNLIKEKSKKAQQTFKPFQIKMKALKINENFSLKVVDQATVYLLFRDGTTNLKINLGMEMDTKEIVDTDISEIGDVSNKMEDLPACTASIAELQKHVAQARAAENRRATRARHRYLPRDSADVLRSGISRPLRTPIVACSCASKRSKSISCGCYSNDS